MKQLILKTNSYLLLAILLIVSPSLISGQAQSSLFIDDNDLFIYTASYNYGLPIEPVEKVLLSITSDQIIIKKKPEVSKVKIEEVIQNVVPSSILSWADDDVCSVTANQSLLSCLDDLLADDDIISAKPAYIRKLYKDLMDFYPVKQVAVYGITDEIYALQKSDNDDEVDALLSSLGCRVESVPGINGYPRSHRIYVPKGTDAISVANVLYETGNFMFSEPKYIKILKDIESTLPDSSEYVFIYDSNGNKTYLYKAPGMFMITKGSATEKRAIEELIDRYLTSSYCKWITDDRCQVETYDKFVDEALSNLRNEQAVTSANRSYFMKQNYEQALLIGEVYPNVYNFDQVVTLSFKDGVPESVKDSFAVLYNISMIDDHSGFYSTWMTSKNSDIITTINSIYESGNVKWVSVDWITGFTIIDRIDPYMTGISSTYVEADGMKEAVHYGLDGRITDPSTPGVHIIRLPDGTVNKTIVTRQ